MQKCSEGILEDRDLFEVFDVTKGKWYLKKVPIRPFVSVDLSTIVAFMFL